MSINHHCFLLVLACLPATAMAETRYFANVPDFTQTEVQGKAFGNGQQFCAPAAVSNSLLWLGADAASQKDLVELLASPSYMNTNLKIGTGTSELLHGVDRFVREEFGDYETLTYQGWRKHPGQFSDNNKVPTLDFMARGVADQAAAWVNIGWYRVNASEGAYVRVGGHWVTLVGYDLEKQQLIINDPAPRAGNNHTSHHVSFRELTGGRLTGKKFGLPTDAAGYLQLGRGLRLHARADTAIIDGVVLLEL